jgi:hypothetical protein
VRASAPTRPHRRRISLHHTDDDRELNIDASKLEASHFSDD